MGRTYAEVLRSTQGTIQVSKQAHQYIYRETPTLDNIQRRFMSISPPIGVATLG